MWTTIFPTFFRTSSLNDDEPLDGCGRGTFRHWTGAGQLMTGFHLLIIRSLITTRVFTSKSFSPIIRAKKRHLVRFFCLTYLSHLPDAVGRWWCWWRSAGTPIWPDWRKTMWTLPSTCPPLTHSCVREPQIFEGQKREKKRSPLGESYNKNMEDGRCDGPHEAIHQVRTIIRGSTAGDRCF